MNFRTLLIAGIIGTSTVMAGCAQTRTQQSAGEYSADAAITAKVKAKLLETKDIRSVDINVETFRKTVQLSGFVDSSEQIARAVAVTRSVEGVESVKNDLRVKGR
ncbi:BON domain-containing protein [Pigmentiphaga litoralis]|jgi:osmotically-inducible protein OsmY|uniref:BON domain-containing protein n=1 Tax=Pigmentiphaga litoralis TaxID=516702 RepID=UPI00167BCE47|nr:BON domain-containing protein [Pigmentiphaga litoralis]GGX35467.1 BON domain-containing protein [Pigmentiphaga litoralis]